jgi:prepilin-type N-terminal cleavage/methylation domain-containing protein
MNHYIKERREEGFTLIELLIAIVVVGILTAVVIVGIGGLTDNGKSSACAASRDAAKTAAAVHKANTGSWPTAFTDYTAAELDTTDVTVAATTLKHGTDWTLTGTFSATTPPALVCS